MGRDISESVQIIAASLARWQAMLDDVALLRDMPRVFRDNLMHLAEDLQRRGIIDPLERFDMNEMVEAAYTHETEEQQLLHRYFIRSGNYRLVYGDISVGVLRGTCLGFGDAAFGRGCEYDGRIQRTENGLEAICRTKREVIGRVDGKRYIAADGQEYELVETSRIVGTEIPALDEPDIYRGVLDAIQYATEQGDSARHAALTLRASISIFMPCPTCEDRFLLREDCAKCDGQGFVRETPDRFRWRS